MPHLKKHADLNFITIPDRKISKIFDLYVDNEDWGVVTQKLTIKYKQIFAVLNMVNWNYLGGGYLTGG